jgi:hypothetical protein
LLQRASQTDPQAKQEVQRLLAEAAHLLRGRKTEIPISNALYSKLASASPPR